MSDKYVSKVATLFSMIETRLPGLCNSILVSDLIAHRMKYKTTGSLIRSVGIWYFAFVLVVLQMLKLFNVGSGMTYSVRQCYSMVAPLFSKAKRVRESSSSFDLSGAGLVKY